MISMGANVFPVYYHPSSYRSAALSIWDEFKVAEVEDSHSLDRWHPPHFGSNARYWV